MRLSNVVAGLGAMLAGLLAGACGPKDAPATAPGTAPGPGDGAATLRIGVEAAYPPFESTNDKGEIIGFDIDLARGLAQHLGRTPEFRNMGFDALLPELQAGRIDCICSGMSWTEERAKVVTFSRPYVLTRMGVLVGAVRARFVTKFSDLDAEDRVIAVQRGTSGETKAKEAFPSARLAPYDNEVDASNEVAAGRADAFVYDMVSVKKLAEKAGDKVRVLPGDLGTEKYCIAFPKGSPVVASANAFLDDASKPGGLLAKLMEQWKPAAELVPPGTR